MEEVAARLGNHRAFTVIELLLTIAIISVLISMLVPAVQKARATAERIHCTNQLRQLSLALIRNHDERGALPIGVTPLPAKYDYPYMSWAVRLLPFVEQ